MDPFAIAQIALAAVQDILFAAATGLLAYGVMGKRSGLIRQDALRGWRGVVTAVLVLTALGYLWLQATVMSGSSLGDAGAAIGPVLTESHFGVAWSIGFAGALLAALSCLPRDRGLERLGRTLATGRCWPASARCGRLAMTFRR